VETDDIYCGIIVYSTCYSGKEETSPKCESERK